MRARDGCLESSRHRQTRMSHSHRWALLVRSRRRRIVAWQRWRCYILTQTSNSTGLGCWPPRANLDNFPQVPHRTQHRSEVGTFLRPYHQRASTAYGFACWVFFPPWVRTSDGPIRFVGPPSRCPVLVIHRWMAGADEDSSRLQSSARRRRRTNSVCGPND